MPRRLLPDLAVHILKALAVPGSSPQQTLMEIPAVGTERGGWGQGEGAAAGPGQKVSCRHLGELSFWCRGRHASLPPSLTSRDN